MANTLKKQRIDLRLSPEDKSLIENAASISNLTLSQFMLASASARAMEVIEQQQRIVLNEALWKRVMEAISNSPEPNEKLKQAARSLQNME